MGNCFNKKDEKILRLQEELLQLKKHTKSLQSDLETAQKLENELKVKNFQNATLEIQYLRVFLSSLQTEKEKILNWKHFTVLKTFSKVLSKKPINKYFSMWKKLIDQQSESIIKHVLENEALPTMESLEAYDNSEQEAFEYTFFQAPTKQETPISKKTFYRMFEDFIFHKYLQDIKDQISQQPIKSTSEAFEVYLKLKHSGSTEKNVQTVISKIEEKSKNCELLKVFTELISSNSDISESVKIIIKDVIISFNLFKTKEKTFYSNSNFNSERLQNGKASVLEVFRILNKFIGSKRMVCRVLMQLCDEKIQKTEFIKNLVLEVMDDKGIHLDDFYYKLRCRKDKIRCRDLADGIKFYCEFRIDENFKEFCKVFGHDDDSEVTMRNFLQCLEKSKKVDSEVSKVNVLKAIIKVYKSIQADSVNYALSLFEDNDSETIDFCQFKTIVRKLNKKCDAELISGLFEEGVRSENCEGRLSKESFRKVLMRYGIGKRELWIFRRMYEGAVEFKPRRVKRGLGVLGVLLNDSQSSPQVITEDLEFFIE